MGAKKQKIHSTTQDFTEIVDIIDDVVYFKGKRACMVLEVSSVNFFLLSSDEQSARIYGFMSLLNSLSFAIQILIVSRKVDMSGYLDTLEKKIDSSQNPRLQEHLRQYYNFIEEMVKGEGLLDKKTYIIIPVSYLELGAVPTIKKDPKKKTGFMEDAKSALLTKRSAVVSQVERMGLSARPLSTNELIKLFYELYNQDFINVDFNSSDVTNIVL